MGAKTGWDAGLSPSLKGNCVAAPGAVAVVNGRDVDTVASQSVRFLLSWPSALVFWADITSTPPSLPQTVFNPQCSLRYSPPDSWAGSAQSLHVAAPCGLAILPVVSGPMSLTLTAAASGPIREGWPLSRYFIIQSILAVWVLGDVMWSWVLGAQGQSMFERKSWPLEAQSFTSHF